MATKGAEVKETIDDHFRSLKVAVTKEDFKGVIAAADKVLAIAPKDGDAYHCKVIALMQSNEFKAAIDTIDSAIAADASLSSLFVFERVYALYRNKQYQPCLDALRGMSDGAKNASIWHLEAQVNYRLANFVRAIEIYERYFTGAAMTIEVKTNMLAAYVSAGVPTKALAFIAQLQRDGDAEEFTFEAAYNAACALIEAGDINGASQQLEQAEKLGRDTFGEEGLSEAEVKDELAGVLVQQAYVLQSQDQFERAHDLYTSVLQSKPSDQAVVATASNNLISLRKQDEKMFDSLKRSEKAVGVDEEKLSARQKRAIHLNRCLLLMYGKKGEQSQAIVATLQKEFPHSEVPVLVQASLYFREKRFDKCTEVLNAYIKQHPTTSLQCQLTLAHIPLLQGNVTAAVDALRSAGLSHRLAVVATIVTIHERAKNNTAAGDVFNQAIAYWSEQKTQDVRTKRNIEVLLDRAAQFHMRNRSFAQAVDLLKRLTRESTDVERQKGYSTMLVMAQSQLDPAATSAKSSTGGASLPPLPDAARVNVDNLEKLPPPRSEVRRVKKAAAAAAPVDGDDEKKEPAKKAKKQRKRKPRVPKGGIVAGVVPDPERWLPRWERSTFKKIKKRRGIKDTSKTGSQGAAPVVSGNKVGAAAAAATSPKNAPAEPVLPTPPPQPKKSKAQAGSKRKGKK